MLDLLIIYHLKIFYYLCQKFLIMEKLLKNSKEYLELTKDHKRDFLDQLYQFLIDDHATVVDYQKLKIKSTAAICPNAKPENVRHHFNKRQKYDK